MFRVIAVLTAFSGCVTLPTVGTPATGERLGVRSFTETYSVTEQVKVGEVRHYNASGSTVGTSSVYADQTRLVSETKFRHYQGDSQVDEQDFFRIAGDVQAEQKVIDYRRNSVLLNKIGWSAVGVGAVMLVVGLVVNAASARTDEYGRSTSPGAGGLIVSTLGAVIGGSGFYLSYYASNRVSPDFPVNHVSRAQVAAGQYNAALQTEERRPADAPRKVPLVPASKPVKRVVTKSL